MRDAVVRQFEMVATGTVAVGSVLFATLRWWSAASPPRSSIAVASVLGILIFVVFCVLLTRRLLAGLPKAYLRSVQIVASVLIAFTLVSWVGFDWLFGFGGLLGLGISFSLVTVFVIRHHRGAWEAWLVGIPAAAGLLAGLVLFTDVSTDIGNLVWASSDQGVYAGIADQLFRFRFGDFYYLLGLPALLSPVAFLLAAQSYADGLAFANAVNVVVLPLQIGIVLPLSIGLLARAASPMRRKPGFWTAGLIGAVFLCYLALPPGFVPERDARLIPLRLVGGVLGPEILGLLFLAVALAVLARPGEKWDPVLVGSILGFAVVSAERHGLLVAPFLLLMLSLRNRYRLAAKTTAVAIAIAMPQFLYFKLAYGSWLFPNRTSLQLERIDIRAVAYQDRYDFPISGEAFDVSYLDTNLPQIIFQNWWLYALLLAGVIVAFLMRPDHWRLWSYCLSVAFATVLMSAIWINIDVTWRYTWWVASLSAVPFAMVTNTYMRSLLAREGRSAVS
jgi:hypothetical protein